MNYNGIEFDDYSNNDNGGIWSRVCVKHAGKFNRSLLSPCPSTSVCGVAGCNETAKYYIDFPEGEAQ